MQVVGGLFILLHFWLLTSTPPVPSPRGWLAILLYWTALALFWWAVHSHREQSPSICFTPDVPEKLVTAGPYRWVRHPFYSAYMMAWWAGIIATGEPWLLCSVVVMSAFYTQAATSEEQIFRQGALAGEFEEYRRTTGMFFPWATLVRSGFKESPPQRPRDSQ